MKILVTVPAFNLVGGGGVANQYLGLEPYWKQDIKYCIYGKRKHISAMLMFIPDLFYYFFRLLFGQYDVVVVNPSFRKYQLFRDGLYLVIAKILGKKIVTFFHGWDVNLASKYKTIPGIFRYVYSKNNLIFVLAKSFREQLREMGINCPVEISTTKVEDSLLSGFLLSNANRYGNRILFLARTAKEKGLDIAIQAFHIAVKRNPNLFLDVAGEGDYLQEMKKYVEQNHIPNVEFYGFVSGNRKIELLLKADIYILPSWEEGLATSVLEAMAFGLVVISRPVGGIVDFFINDKMGYLTESLKPDDYAEIIMRYINNKLLIKEISRYNYEYAKEHFLASKVAENIESQILDKCI